MKELLIIIGVIGFIVACVWAVVVVDNKCEEMGGVVVNSGRGVNNCWKDGNFVEVEL